jgi:F-type H+-transporting ATPase subunit b
MDTVLRQIGELLIKSIPTIISVLVLWTAYTFLVHNKLRQVLAQRHALTEGAIERAQQEIAIAEKRTAEYEQRVREARSQIYKAQQANRLRVMEERNAALAESRQRAGEMVKKARAGVEAETAAARATLEQQANMLADQVIATILKPAAAAGGR